MINRKSLLLAAALALAGASAHAGTTSVNFKSESNVRGLGSFAGSASYDSATEKLTLKLDNTSATKSVITGFAFDIAGDDKAAYERIGHSRWKDDRHGGAVKAKPHGTYEAGAALGGKFGAHGPKQGIAMGAEKTFVFDITGAGAGNLTAADFFSGPANKEIVASFAGFKHHHTDKAAGVMLIADNNTTIPTGGTTPPTGGTLPPTGGTPPIVKTDGPPAPGDKSPNGGVTAVPLPPAAYSGLLTLAALAAARRRFVALA